MVFIVTFRTSAGLALAYSLNASSRVGGTQVVVIIIVVIVIIIIIIIVIVIIIVMIITV